MGYVTHRQGLYRTGFRPIGQTNTFAAAQGTGISPDETAQMGLMRTPFDPEIFHERLGQWHPFTPGGGYGLHGLGDIVPNGSVVTYTGQWPTDIKTTPDQLLAAVVQALKRDGLSVINSSQSGGFIGAVFTGSFTATLQIQVSNGMGFGQPGDIGSIVDHEVYMATGEMPSGSGVSVNSIPGSTPGLPLPAASDFMGWLQQNAMWLGLGLLGVVILPDLVRKL